MRPDIVVVFPEPFDFVPPGEVVIVHDPIGGSPLNPTLPVDEVHVGCVITPIKGIEGLAFTVSIKEAVAAEHPVFLGISVVTVICTCIPASPIEGVYIIVKGVLELPAGVTLPVPFAVIVTFFALPPNVLPFIVKGTVLHVLPLVLVSVTVGPFTHCPNIPIENNIKRVIKRKTLVISFKKDS